MARPSLHLGLAGRAPPHGQYLAVYFRALSYFRQTFGACSCMHVAFAAVGFPFGLLALDLLMFLELLGLLAVLPLPLWLKQFLPAYKATRIVIEVSLEPSRSARCSRTSSS